MPYSNDNSGRRIRGVRGGPSIVKPGRLAKNADAIRCDFVSMTSAQLVHAATGGTVAAIEAKAELARRGRGPDGVKLNLPEWLRARREGRPARPARGTSAAANPRGFRNPKPDVAYLRQVAAKAEHIMRSGQTDDLMTAWRMAKQ